MGRPVHQRRVLRRPSNGCFLETRGTSVGRGHPWRVRPRRAGKWCLHRWRNLSEHRRGPSWQDHAGGVIGGVTRDLLRDWPAIVDRSAWRTCSSGKRHGNGDRRKGTARDSSAVLSPHWRRRWSGRDRRIYLAGPRARNRRAMHHLSRDPRSGRGLVRSPGRRCESRGLAVAGNWRGHDLNAVARAFFKSKRGDILETVPAVRLVVANRLKVRP